jgi:hypothetical protein
MGMGRGRRVEIVVGMAVGKGRRGNRARMLMSGSQSPRARKPDERSNIG